MIANMSGFIREGGLRQADALSPYLFVLCVKRLNHLIKRSVDEGHWKGIGLSRHGAMIIHLFFADDLALLVEASVKQMREVKRCLETLCVASRQRVRLNKYEVFLSSNVSGTEVTALLELVGMPQMDNLGRYSGVPSIHGRVTKTIFHPMI